MSASSAVPQPKNQEMPSTYPTTQQVNTLARDGAFLFLVGLIGFSLTALLIMACVAAFTLPSPIIAGFFTAFALTLRKAVVIVQILRVRLF
jgi:uncharacterized membrane protein